jgi:hypothetical protein
MKRVDFDQGSRGPEEEPVTAAFFEGLARLVVRFRVLVVAFWAAPEPPVVPARASPR